MIEDKNVKLCKNCKFYRHFWLDSNLSYCGNTKARDYRIDPVTGKIKYAFCHIERTDYKLRNDSFCGPDAKFFEPRKSIWKRLFKEVFCVR